MSISEHNTASVYTKFEQLLVQMQQMLQQSFHDRTISGSMHMCEILRDSHGGLGQLTVLKPIPNWELLCKTRFHNRDKEDEQHADCLRNTVVNM